MGINAQLVDGETGAHVWADRFDKSLADLFAAQDRGPDRPTAGRGPRAGSAARGTLVAPGLNGLLFFAARRA